jgi:uncharacterized protein
MDVPSVMIKTPAGQFGSATPRQRRARLGRRIILFALLIGCEQAEAEDWVPLSQNGNKSFYFEGTGHFTVPSANPPVACLRYQPAGGCVAHVKAKIVYTTHTEHGEGVDVTRWVTYRLMSLAFDCTADRIRMESLTTFFDDSTSRAASEEAMPLLLNDYGVAAWIFAKDITCDPVLAFSAQTARKAAASPPAPDAAPVLTTVLRILKPKGDPREYSVSMGAAAQTYSVAVDGKAVEGSLADMAAYTVASELRDEGDYKHAELILRPLADRGLVDAQFRLGSMYEYGEGVTQDYTEAVNWYRRAADQKQPQAELMLGSAYDRGHGVAKDEVESLRWYRLAADHGLDAAQLLLGNAYQFGLGVPKDQVEAARLYRLAADQGLPLAQFKLGAMYKYGDGVRQSNNEAIRWWRMAADNNDGEAQFALGMAYVKGDGIRRDYEEAVKWLRRAAQQEDATAQIALGARYMQGQGVRKDPAQAYKWFSIAIAKLPKPDDENRALAIRDRERALGELSPEEVTKADVMAKECLAHKYKDCE